MRNRKSSSQAARLPVDAFSIDRASREPIQQQIYTALRDLILRGVLTPGLKLPSSRELSRNILVSRNTVVRAYEQLNSEGYVETRHGAKTYVANIPPPSSPAVRHDISKMAGRVSRFAHAFDPEKRISFSSDRSALRPSTPDVAVFPFTTWNRLFGRYLLHPNVDLFNYNYDLGYPPLQAAIARYIQAYRGVVCEPEQVVVTNGAQAALDLLSRMLLKDGDVVWMEEPGYVNARLVFSAAGADIEPLNVTEEGWGLQNVPEGNIQLIYTTPSCQHPLGLSMRVEQRLRLLDIANRKAAWIIEDDFDSEYRLFGRSIPAMQGNDKFGLTIYVGTFAKTLFPAIRVGFMVVPQSICEQVKRAALYCGQQVSLPLQATLSDFIMNGHFASHLRRTRRLYAERREAFLKLGHKYLNEWMEPFEADVGIQIAFRFKRPLDDVAIASKANDMKLNVVPLSRYYYREPIRGLLLGYAAIDERAMQSHLALLAEVIKEQTS
ncbi:MULTISPECIES: PLP-dependent aminotransferase family protein [Sinorhizobium]|uniref:rhizopine catabolism transcriptional regulator MocR n=1 Tax=Rhizobium meliloti TaxID=382 RepID=UPI001F47486F|nr:PLP-dependent aminotransferase family protein [Sinorhizobium meliloti]